MTAVASVADVAEEHFAPFYDAFMPGLKAMLQGAQGKEYRMLRGEAAGGEGPPPCLTTPQSGVHPVHPGLSTAPRRPARWLQEPGPRLRTPERRRSRLEARHGLRWPASACSEEANSPLSPAR